MTAEHDGYDGPDPLMSAITDEPLTEAARTDPAFLAEHRSATTDVAVLREQLAIIGQALAGAPGALAADRATLAAGTEAEAEVSAAGPAGAGPETRPVPVGDGKYVPVRPSRPRPRPRSRPRRRPLALAFGTLAVACAGALVAGLGWLVVQAGTGHDDAGGTRAASDSGPGAREVAGTLFGSPRYLACARLVAEGTVTDVQRMPGGEQERIALDVTRPYKPGKAEDPVTFVREPGVHPRLRTGDRVLVGIPRQAAGPDAVFVGERKIAPERARITRSLPESRTLTCT